MNLPKANIHQRKVKNVVSYNDEKMNQCGSFFYCNFLVLWYNLAVGVGYG